MKIANWKVFLFIALFIGIFVFWIIADNAKTARGEKNWELAAWISGGIVLLTMIVGITTQGRRKV